LLLANSEGDLAMWDECVDEAYAILPSEAEFVGADPSFDQYV